MADLPKFMVAENPMAQYGVEYIYHTQPPRFLARVADDGQSIEVVDQIDDPIQLYGAERAAGKLAGLMRRMGDWWVAYCKWEEQNYNDE